MRKTFLINVVAGCLTLCMVVAAQGAYTYTTLDVPGASNTYAWGIDGSNIVGHYQDGSGFHGFRATFGGTPVPLPAAAWMALPLLGVMCVIGKMRRRRCA